MTVYHCEQCRQEYVPGQSHQRFCSRKCGAQWRNRQKKALTGGRVCHDCGRTTHNYRCPECLLAWRKKHGVSEHAA